MGGFAPMGAMPGISQMLTGQFGQPGQRPPQSPAPAPSQPQPQGGGNPQPPAPPPAPSPATPQPPGPPPMPPSVAGTLNAPATPGGPPDPLGGAIQAGVQQAAAGQQADLQGYMQNPAIQNILGALFGGGGGMM